MKKKILLLIILLSVILGITLRYIARNEKDFIYVVPKIKNIEVLNRDIGNYSLIKENGDILKTPNKNFLNGKIFLNVPNGDYILKADFDDEVKSINIIKSSDWEKVKVNLEGDYFSKKQEIFLNIITLTLIVFNFAIFNRLRNKIKKNKILSSLFGLLLLKLIFSFRGSFQTDFLLFLDFFITRILGFALIFYILENIIPKNKKIVRVLTYTAVSIVYFYNFIFAVAILSPQIYIYLLTYCYKLFKICSEVRKFIDLTRIIFVLIIYSFIRSHKKLKKLDYICWLAIGIGYFILEFFHNLFPSNSKLYYFIELIEFMCVYWGLIFSKLKVYTKELSRAVRYVLGLMLAYISLFYFKTLTEPFVILSTIFLLDFYTMVFDRIMKETDSSIEKIYNKLSLIHNKRQFEIQLEKEIKKHLKINTLIKIFSNSEEVEKYIYNKDDFDEDIVLDKDKIKIPNYNLGFRMEFNGNPYVGIILLKESNEEISYDQYQYLRNIAVKLSNIASKIRLNSLYEELVLDD